MKKFYIIIVICLVCLVGMKLFSAHKERERYDISFNIEDKVEKLIETHFSQEAQDEFIQCAQNFPPDRTQVYKDCLLLVHDLEQDLRNEDRECISRLEKQWAELNVSPVLYHFSLFKVIHHAAQCAHKTAYLQEAYKHLYEAVKLGHKEALLYYIQWALQSRSVCASDIVFYIEKLKKVEIKGFELETKLALAHYDLLPDNEASLQTQLSARNFIYEQCDACKDLPNSYVTLREAGINFLNAQSSPEEKSKGVVLLEIYAEYQRDILTYLNLLYLNDIKYIQVKDKVHIWKDRVQAELLKDSERWYVQWFRMLALKSLILPSTIEFPNDFSVFLQDYFNAHRDYYAKTLWDIRPFMFNVKDDEIVVENDYVHARLTLPIMQDLAWADDKIEPQSHVARYLLNTLSTSTSNPHEEMQELLNYMRSSEVDDAQREAINHFFIMMNRVLNRIFIEDVQEWERSLLALESSEGLIYFYIYDKIRMNNYLTKKDPSLENLVSGYLMKAVEYNYPKAIIHWGNELINNAKVHHSGKISKEDKALLKEKLQTIPDDKIYAKAKARLLNMASVDD